MRRRRRILARCDGRMWNSRLSVSDGSAHVRREVRGHGVATRWNWMRALTRGCSSLRRASARSRQHPGASCMGAVAAASYRAEHGLFRRHRVGPSGELAAPRRQIGLFINTLPVVDSCRARSRTLGWLRELQAQSGAARVRLHPLYEIQRWAGRAGQPLFDNILVFENYPVDRRVEREAGAVCVGTRIIETSNYPLFAERRPR